MVSAVDLAWLKMSITVAGQRRILTGFAASLGDVDHKANNQQIMIILTEFYHHPPFPAIEFIQNSV